MGPLGPLGGEIQLMAIEGREDMANMGKIWENDGCSVIWRYSSFIFGEFLGSLKTGKRD